MTSNTRISLIGAPTDIGASCIGARMGPGALRVAGLTDALQRCGLAVQDLGDLHGPDNPCQDAVDGWRHLREVYTSYACHLFRHTMATLATAHLGPRTAPRHRAPGGQTGCGSPTAPTPSAAAGC